MLALLNKISDLSRTIRLLDEEQYGREVMKRIKEWGPLSWRQFVWDFQSIKASYCQGEHFQRIHHSNKAVYGYGHLFFNHETLVQISWELICDKTVRAKTEERSTATFELSLFSVEVCPEKETLSEEISIDVAFESLRIKVGWWFDLIF